jgi:hypothetical protein
VVSLKRFNKCVLHIGTEKTGTTSLQKMLLLNHEALLEQGFFVPRSLSPYAKLLNHERLTTFSLADNKFNDDVRRSAGVTDTDSLERHRAKVIADFDKELNNLPDEPHTLLLSNEHLSSRLTSTDEIEILKTTLERYVEKIEILVYLRPQFSLALSGYNQAIKAGHHSVSVLPSFEPTQLPAKHWANRYYFDYLKILTNWETVFGVENIHPRLFTLRDLVEADIIADYASFIGLDLHHLVVPSRENETLSPLALRLLEVINRRTSDSGSPMNPETRAKLVEALASVKGVSSSLATKDEILEFQKHFFSQNDVLRAKWFPLRSTLFALDLTAFPDTIIKKELDVNEVIDVFCQLFKSLT